MYYLCTRFSKIRIFVLYMGSPKISNFWGERRQSRALWRLATSGSVICRTRHGGLSSVGRASDCGSECRGFEPHIPPENKNESFQRAHFCFQNIWDHKPKFLVFLADIIEGLLHQLGNFFFGEIANDHNHRTVLLFNSADYQFVRLAPIGKDEYIIAAFRMTCH